MVLLRPLFLVGLFQSLGGWLVINIWKVWFIISDKMKRTHCCLSGTLIAQTLPSNMFFPSDNQNQNQKPLFIPEGQLEIDKYCNNKENIRYSWSTGILAEDSHLSLSCLLSLHTPFLIWFETVFHSHAVQHEVNSLNTHTHQQQMMQNKWTEKNALTLIYSKFVLANPVSHHDGRRV